MDKVCPSVFAKYIKILQGNNVHIDKKIIRLDTNGNYPMYNYQTFTMKDNFNTFVGILLNNAMSIKYVYEQNTD